MSTSTGLLASYIRQLGASEVLIDIGSGLGLAAVQIQQMTGATVIGVEVQPKLHQEAIAVKDLLYAILRTMNFLGVSKACIEGYKRGGS